MGGHIVEFLLHIAGEFGEYLSVSLEIALPGDKIVGPVHNNVPCAQIQRRLGTQPNQGGTVDASCDPRGLPGLNVHADFHQQMGIFIELGFKIFRHGRNLFFIQMV